jgi:lysophospholipase L1-like esterase
VIVLEGINDIGIPGAFGLAAEAVSAEDLIAGHAQFVARAHAKGLLIYGATLTAFEGTLFPGYFTAAGEAKRQAVNHWIRTSGAYDAVIDFDRATRDPSHPSRLLPAYDSGDHLHPNDAGYEAMAKAVDLSLFRRGGD